MTYEIIRSVLAWSAVLNYAILLIWFGVFYFFHEWLYSFHGNWFELSVEKFDLTHYAGMAFFKLSIFLLYLAPYLSLRIID